MTIAILADQCVGIPILQALEGAGFDVVRSSDVLPASAPDADVLAPWLFAKREFFSLRILILVRRLYAWGSQRSASFASILRD